MKIIDRQGKRVRLSQARQPTGERGLSPEQWEIIEALESDKNVLILKPRQIGSTTITQAWAFHYGWKCKDPIRILTMTHESGACTRVNNMLRNYWRGLPRDLRPPLEPNNQHNIGFARKTADGEDAEGVVFTQYMSGGRGQGRSWTYNIVIFTEMGLYPQGSASVKGGTEADADAVESVLSTMHEGPHTKVIIESTGDGPSGKFYEMVKLARESDEWIFLFFRWFDFDHYERTPPASWTRRVDELESAERIAVAQGCDINDPIVDRKLCWRRYKLESEGYSLMRFRREYPETWQDPFLLTEDTWFDSELCNRVLGRLPPWSKEDLVVYHEPEQGHRYFIGMDTSGGKGKDHSVIVVLRDDFEVAAVWGSNKTTLLGQAEMASRLAAFYSTVDQKTGDALRCRVLVERNKYGGTVIKHLNKLGVSQWTDSKGKYFWMQRGQGSDTKFQVYSHAQRLVNHMVACSAATDQPPLINDPRILEQMIIIREGDNGNIEAPDGEHDDFCDAYVLALWCAKGHYVFDDAPAPTKGQVQHAVRRRLRG
jgi:hypothetical protein